MTGRAAISRRALLGGGLLAAAALAACGPPSTRRAYEQCSERARLAAGPTGRVGIGVGNRGVVADADLTISSDFIAGRNPQAVYDRCFRRMTGAGPTRPLVL